MKTPCLCRCDIQHEMAVSSVYILPSQPTENGSLLVRENTGNSEICSQSRQLSQTRYQLMHCQQPVAVLSRLQKGFLLSLSLSLVTPPEYHN